MHYSRLQPEPDIPSSSNTDNTKSDSNSSWPSSGALQVEELTVRYYMQYTVPESMICVYMCDSPQC
jgi:hypothetical protein